ncbi:hypothetical protein BH09BAC6_BH09BAC6_32510 [soil metagenome]|jgi:hypothetical protein
MDCLSNLQHIELVVNDIGHKIKDFIFYFAPPFIKTLFYG